MSKKKQKRKKKRERLSRQANRPSKRAQKSPSARTGSAAGRSPEPASLQGGAKLPVDAWWAAFSKADVEERLRMTRDKLQSVGPRDPSYEELFPEAILELEGELPPERYVAFLEEVLDSRPDIFALSSHWNAISMAIAYASDNRCEQLKRVMRHVASEMTSVDDAHFVLISILRLAGQEEAAQEIIDAAIPLIDVSGLMEWGVDQLIGWAMFEANQRCAAAGVTEEAIEESYEFLLGLGVEDSDQARRHQREHAIYWAGKADKQWSPDDFFLEDQRRVANHIYLLLVDFMRWLCESRGLPPIAADEFRNIMVDCIDSMKRPVKTFLTGLKQTHFEPFLVRKLDFLSLDRVHAPAAVIGMLHFYDFLAEGSLVDGPTHDSATRTCTILWKELKQVMRSEWGQHAFLERWLPTPSPIRPTPKPGLRFSSVKREDLLLLPLSGP